jgi:drug/metabolite transporter (DMT)-like permease
MKTQNSLASALPDRNVLLYFIVFIILMGGAPVAMRITYSEMGPFYMGFLRFGLGAVIYWILIFFKRLQIPHGRSLIGPLLYGVLGIGISFSLIAWGLVKIPASLAAIFLALVPMLTVLLSAIQRLEHFSIQGGFGALLSVAGTIVAVGASSSNGISIIHVSALILGVVFLAQGSVVVKHYPRNSPIITNGLAMTVGAIILAFASFITRESWVVPSQLNTWAALSYLVFFVSFIALLLYLQVLNRWTATGSSYGFVIIPFVTVIISTFLTGEHITLNFLMGLLLVIIGVIIGALIPKKVELTKECATC